jgi:dihydroorotase
MNIEIKNGRVIDTKNKVDLSASLYVAEGKVLALGDAPAGFVADQTIDASGCVVCPGLIDLGARLNSIEAELAAAVAGGVTSVVVPPDADPPLDEPELADRLVHRGAEIGKARVLPLGALTLGLKGERLAELAGLKKAGCVAFSQAKVPVVDTEALVRAMEYAATFNYAVWLQPQDYWLSRNTYRRHVWPGLFTSAVASGTPPWAADEVLAQIALQRQRPGAGGHHHGANRDGH